MIAIAGAYSRIWNLIISRSMKFVVLYTDKQNISQNCKSNLQARFLPTNETLGPDSLNKAIFDFLWSHLSQQNKNSSNNEAEPAAYALQQCRHFLSALYWIRRRNFVQSQCGTTGNGEWSGMRPDVYFCRRWPKQCNKRLFLPEIVQHCFHNNLEVFVPLFIDKGPESKISANFEWPTHFCRLLFPTYIL